MLYRYINQFVEYCQLADFSVRSIQALDIRLNEFKEFLKSQRIQSVKEITYLRLVDFVADYKDPSIHVRKSRVRTLRQFYHFLTLHRYVPQNIALKLPYPKIEKTVPQFLTINEYNSLIHYFSNETQDILTIQSILGHSSTRSTEPYTHPSADRVRKAMEKLPGVRFVKELLRKGELNLSFQKPFRPKKE